MHSRIFQISKKPIVEDDYIREDKYYEHWFVGAIADYVDELTDTKEDIEWLGEMPGLSVNLGEKTLTINSKEEYFREKYKRFIQVARMLINVSFDDFMSNKSSHDVYNLKSAYNEEFEFYVDDNGEYTGLTTLDEFVRHTNNGEIYYIGNILDYHY